MHSFLECFFVPVVDLVYIPEENLVLAFHPIGQGCLLHYFHLVDPDYVWVLRSLSDAVMAQLYSNPLIHLING